MFGVRHASRAPDKKSVPSRHFRRADPGHAPSSKNSGSITLELHSLLFSSPLSYTVCSFRRRAAARAPAGRRRVKQQAEVVRSPEKNIERLTVTTIKQVVGTCT